MSALTLDDIERTLKDKPELTIDDIHETIGSSTNKNKSKKSSKDSNILRSVYGGLKKFVTEEVPGAISQVMPKFNLDVKNIRGSIQGPEEPLRPLKNVTKGFLEFGQGLYNSPRNVADYLASKGIIYEKNAKTFAKQNFDYDNFLGIKGTKQGDELLQSLGNPLTYAGEFGALSGLGRAGARFVAGATKGITENQNPLLAGTLQSTLGGAVDYAPKLYGNLKATAGAGIKNYALNKARGRDYEMSPKMAEERINLKYKTPEGEVLPGDFGTLVGNKFLQNLYKVTSHIPGAKGYPQRRVFEAKLRENERVLAEIENKEIHEGLSAEEIQQKKYLELANKHIEDAGNMQRTELTPEKSRKLEEQEQLLQKNKKIMEETPKVITKLRHPEKEHGELFEEEARSSIKRNKEKANELYRDFNESQDKINLNQETKAPDSSRFHEAYKKYAEDIDGMRSLFGDASDAGPKLVKEIKRLHEFFRPKESPPTEGLSGTGKDISTATKPTAEPITPKQINDHIRTLQKEAARLTSEGNNIDARPLWDLSESLKHDLHAILEHNGYKKEAASLKSGNDFFMNNIIPWSKHPETRKIIRNKNYKPDTASFSKAIHNPNLKAVYNSLPKSVRNAAAYEILVKNAQKAGTQGHYLTTKEVMTSYMKGMDQKAKNALAENNPEVHAHLESLPEVSNAITEHTIAIKELDAERKSIESAIQDKLRHGESLSFNANKELNKINKRRNAADEALKSHVKNVFHGKTNVSTKITKADSVKSLGYGALAAHGFGTMGHFLAGHGLGAGALYGTIAKGAKEFNKMMTDPAMVKHFLEGTKFKKQPYPPKEPTYVKKLSKALTLLGTKQPLEIDMTGGHRQ